jgi:hypothetical protein
MLKSESNDPFVTKLRQGRLGRRKFSFQVAVGRAKSRVEPEVRTFVVRVRVRSLFCLCFIDFGRNCEVFVPNGSRFLIFNVNIGSPPLFLYRSLFDLVVYSIRQLVTQKSAKEISSQFY